MYDNLNLQFEDKVHVVAPSSVSKTEELDYIKEYIRSLYLTPKISYNIYKTDLDMPWLANTVEFRAKDLADALTDNSKIVWCIRGGSGASALLSQLDQLLPQELPPKIFIGYSDITILHNYLNTRYDWPSIHGPMLEWIVDNKNSSSVNLLEKLIIGESKNVNFGNLKALNDQYKDVIESRIIGGNLTVFETTTGTNWQPKTDGKIIFFEDIREEPYMLARSLEHFAQAHFFDNVSAVIFGDFIEPQDEKGFIGKFFDSISSLIFGDVENRDGSIIKVKEKFAQSVDFPVFSVSGIGHDNVNNPLILNSPSTISCDGQGNCSLMIDNPWFKGSE